eukprot:939075_1
MILHLWKKIIHMINRMIMIIIIMKQNHQNQIQMMIHLLVWLNKKTDNNDLLGVSGDNINDIKQDDIGINEQKEKSEDEPTFLSVWQEERKLELEKRRNQEKEAQAKLLETAQTELEKFQSDRAKRIENKKKENREKESDLRDDLDAVFKHGTIWEQVGKMVNLNEKITGLNKFDKDRFRDLLIHLRNAKQ